MLPIVCSSLDGEMANFHEHHNHGTRAHQNAAHRHCISKQGGFWSHLIFFSPFTGFPITLTKRCCHGYLGACFLVFSDSQWLSALASQKPFTPGVSESLSLPLLKTTLGVCRALWPSATKGSGLTPKWCQQKLAAYLSAQMWHQHFYCHQHRKLDWSMEEPA